MFGIASLLPLLVALMSLSIDEEPYEKRNMSDISTASNGFELENDTESNNLDSIRDQISALWDALRQPSIFKPVLFIFLWQATPTSEGAMLYFLTNDIGFGPELLGRVRLVTAASSLFGVWLYQKTLRTVPIKDVLVRICILMFFRSQQSFYHKKNRLSIFFQHNLHHSCGHLSLVLHWDLLNYY